MTEKKKESVFVEKSRQRDQIRKINKQEIAAAKSISNLYSRKTSHAF